MSTEHQRYSIENQLDTISLYAASHGIEIVRTYVDTAKSGLSLAGRPQFARLLADAQSGVADFQAILVYDVSRWGRFQDTDESAHHEFLCKQAGVPVHYCAEKFENDGFAGNILKVLKRASAAEYVRELSVKTFTGQCRTIHNGFHAAGKPGYGLRRMLVDEHGNPKFVLGPGQQKNIHSERIKLVHGPEHEVAVLRRIFRMFALEHQSKEGIANALNAERVPIEPRGIWTRARVHNILTNENYIGNLIFNRKTQRLGTKSRPNPPETWVRNERVFTAIIDRTLFESAQTIIRQRRKKSDAEMLAALDKLHKTHGRLTTTLMEEIGAIPHRQTYRHRFGSLAHAFELIGHPVPFSEFSLRADEEFHRLYLRLPYEIVAQMKDIGTAVESGAHRALFRINEQFILRIVVVPATYRRSGELRWRVMLRTRLKSDATLAVRLREGNGAVLDYFVWRNANDTQVTGYLGGKHSSRVQLSSLEQFFMFCKLNGSHALRISEMDKFLSASDDRQDTLR
jgi:DNA invertase Pin-like site-specific DNA recombinase